MSRIRRIGNFLGAMLLMVGVLSARAPADTDDLLPWNREADQERCPLAEGAVWADHEDGAECIRYFTGGNVEGAGAALVVLRGDREKEAKKDVQEIHRNTAREQQALAERTAREAGLPVILVSRPGTYGSSGDHFARRQRAEFLALDAALDAIRTRHRIGRMVLVGQSGGATAAAALLTLGRTDIACAVLTSGAFSLLERAQMLARQNGFAVEPGLDLTGLPTPYDPLDHVHGIAPDPQRQIIVIGNAKDRITPFVLQRKFADAVRREGHDVRLIQHPAHPPRFHALRGSVGLKTAARCAPGEG